MPSIDDAMMDIESCLGVLEFLAPRVPSAAACHDTLRTLSQAIFKQLSDLDPPHTTVTSSPNRRSLLRSAPISSSREDPLPNVFPAPLPPVALPYELSLLDNLFRNPMASHNKASDYTSNKLCGKRKAEAEGYNQSTPLSMPSRAFHSAGEYPASQSSSEFASWEQLALIPAIQRSKFVDVGEHSCCCCRRRFIHASWGSI